MDFLPAFFAMGAIDRDRRLSLVPADRGYQRDLDRARTEQLAKKNVKGTKKRKKK